MSLSEARHITDSPVPSEEFGDLDDAGDNDDRKSRRKARNRVSAAASRARKKQWVDSLQDEVNSLTAELQAARAARAA